MFLVDHHCKTQSESFDTLEKCRYCLMFLQGERGDNFALASTVDDDDICCCTASGPSVLDGNSDQEGGDDSDGGADGDG